MPVGPQYTSCVEPGDYRELDLSGEAIVGVAGLIAGLVTGGAGLLLSAGAFFHALEEVLDYMLNGKLVCLNEGTPECAIGHVTSFEIVEDKGGFLGLEKIDNDFSINLLLAPQSLCDFHTEPELNPPPATDDERTTAWRKHNLEIARAAAQGRLLRAQPALSGLTPRAPVAGWGNYGGYFNCQDSTSTFAILKDGPCDDSGRDWAVSDVPPFPVPIMHTECEGSRIHDLLKALQAVSSPITGLGAICDFEPFGIPLGKTVCAVIAAFLWPIVFGALVIVWFAADEGDPADAGVPRGELHLGDLVAITGRWVYDAGHGGYNELHGVRTIQKVVVDVSPDTDGASQCAGALDWRPFDDFHQRYCNAISVAPPRPNEPDGRPPGMTPEQSDVWDEQQQPEHNWVLHPDIDGCDPQREPEPVE
jgi:hypothetical protein